MHEKRRSPGCTKGDRKCKTRSSARRRESCMPNTYSKANNDRPKEQDEMEVDSDLLPNDKTFEDRKFRKPKRKGSSTNSLVATLIANNRALAAAHEQVEQELHAVQLQNVQLNKQFLTSHEDFVEKTNDLEQQVQTLKKLVARDTDVVWQNIYNVLQEACTQFLRGSNLLSDALHLVNSILNPVDGHVTVSIQNHVSPHVTFNNVSSHMIIDHMRNSVCTTPPPDEPSAMELTATQSIVIEATDHKQIGVENDHGQVNCNSKQGADFQIQKEDVSSSMGNIAEAMEMDKVEAVNGRKRRRCVAICYTEPCLNSKLRRGDPFTDTSMYTDRPSPKRGKKKKNSRDSMTLSLKKKRVPLTNLTNVISEEN